MYLLWNLSTYRSLICQFKLEVKLFCCKNCIRPVDHGLQNVLVGGHVISHNELFGVAVDAHAFVVFGIPVCVAKLVLNFIEKYLVNHTTTQGIVIHIPTFVGFAWSSLCCIWQVTNEL